MARNNEPALRRKTPLLICSMRTEIPYPCVGSRANVFRMSMSRVPWTRSLGLSGMKSSSPWLPRGEYSSPTGCQKESWERSVQNGPSGRPETTDERSFALVAEMAGTKRIGAKHAHVVAALEGGGIWHRAATHTATHLA